MQEESIRLPLIIWHPNLPKATADAMVLTIDIAPTIMELAGAEVPAGVQGKSLAPLLLGEKVPWRTEWFYEHHYGHKGRIPRSEGVRTDRWKYVRYIDPEPPVEQLFDLRNDPHELKNRIDDASLHGVRDRLKRELFEWLSSVGDDLPERADRLPAAGTILVSGEPGP